MYNSLENAEREHIRNTEKRANFPQIVGDRIAELKIYTGDGYSTLPSKKGHLDLFELKEIDWKKRIMEIYEIKSE